MIEINRGFWGICCLLLQVWNEWQSDFVLISCLAYSYSEDGDECSSETSLDFKQIIRRYITEDMTLFRYFLAKEIRVVYKWNTSIEVWVVPLLQQSLITLLTYETQGSSMDHILVWNEALTCDMNTVLSVDTPSDVFTFWKQTKQNLSNSFPLSFFYF